MEKTWELLRIRGLRRMHLEPGTDLGLRDWPKRGKLCHSHPSVLKDMGLGSIVAIHFQEMPQCTRGERAFLVEAEFLHQRRQVSNPYSSSIQRIPKLNLLFFCVNLKRCFKMTHWTGKIL